MWDTYEKMLENPNVTYKEVKDFISAYMPKKLYRYRKFDKYYQSNIMEGRVYLSFPDAYNDPFDSAVRFDYQKCVERFLGKEAALMYPKIIGSNSVVKEAFDKHYHNTFDNFKRYVKIACFSELNDSILMWSHYAENHSGFCIEYDTSRSNLFKELALPVIYKNERYDASECLLTKNPNIACNPIIYKDSAWAYEKEWRLWGTKDYFQNKPDYLELGNAVSAIYIGACIKDEDKDKVCEIEKWAKTRKIKVYKMRLDDLSYKMLYD